MSEKFILLGKKAFIDAFAPGIFEDIKAYNKAKDPYLKKKLKEAICCKLRKFSDRFPDNISKKAITLANSLGVDLSDKLWKDRNLCGKNKNGKSKIVWEHSTPINDLFNELTKCKDMPSIKKTLDKYSGVVWITREEDDCLNKKGYKKERKGNWRDIYKECGIVLIS